MKKSQSGLVEHLQRCGCTLEEAFRQAAKIQVLKEKVAEVFEHYGMSEEAKEFCVNTLCQTFNMGAAWEVSADKIYASWDRLCDAGIVPGKSNGHKRTVVRVRP